MRQDARVTPRYFKLTDDVTFPGRWELGAPVDAQGQDHGSWLFMQGTPARVESSLRVPSYVQGRALDFSLADAGAVPVVSQPVAEVLARLAPGDVELFPVTVEDSPDPHFLVNVVRVVKCIDDAASGEVRYWTPEDGRPERVGTYQAVHRLRIDPARTGDAKVFRTWGWLIALIVSEDIKLALEAMGATGARFQDVSPVR
ncbi:MULTISPECIES: imm11 family protein [unclassified Corallococcus]|uniref:imm11 family protein n=1 Tax=unclassified Corallococcus TaxID=2685029 RepID=UPI001F5D692A|nr:MULTISPECIES: DUF1629 domain-containing protein [unclassified Corallococcus]WAS87845.1 hypothetical protein O0N60_12895 [Corallococcus sp. NCRR]